MELQAGHAIDCIGAVNLKDIAAVNELLVIAFTVQEIANVIYAMPSIAAAMIAW